MTNEIELFNSRRVDEDIISEYTLRTSPVPFDQPTAAASPLSSSSSHLKRCGWSAEWYFR